MTRNLLLVTLLLCFFQGTTQTWQPISGGLNGQVSAMSSFSGSLYAAGAFTYDGTGTASLSHIARWNGSAWAAAGNGFNNNVKALIAYNGELFAGGDFTMSGTTAVDHIAKWNGSAWIAVGAGLNNTVNCLHVFNGDLYAGGTFTSVTGGITVNRVAKWNGSSWAAIGSGITGGIVNTIASFNNELYAGGTFLSLVSKFNGTTWTAVGSLSGTEVSCLAAWGPNGVSSGANFYLYAGGNITAPSAGMVRWNGTSWNSAVQAFSSSGKPKVLLPAYGYLFAGGGFNITVSIPASHPVVSVARFNNSYWDSVGTGMDNDVLCLTIHNGYLHAGGSFLVADGDSSLHIAKRTSLVGINENEENVIFHDLFPNPFSDEGLLMIKTKIPMHMPVLKIVDLLGRDFNHCGQLNMFNRFNNEIEFRINRAGAPAGIYFYQVVDDSKVLSKGRFIIE